MSASRHAVDSLPMPGAYFRLFLRRFGRDPDLAAQIVEGTGIDLAEAMASGPEDEIELGQQLQQIRNMTRLLAPGWALEVGRSLDAGAHGSLGVAAVSAPTLFDALGVLERFAFVRAPIFRLSSDAGRVFELRIEPQLRIEAEFWPPVMEPIFLSIQALVESALGHAMTDGRFLFDYPAPEHADRYAEFLHAPVVFDQAVCSVAIPIDWLPLPCPFADPALHQSAIERLESSERRLQGEEFIVAQVELILEAARNVRVDVDQVASELHLSRRTLVRRRGRWGTSFREILDEYQRRRATELLADPQLTVAEVADRLGYTEPANFGRACRRWFGTGPRAYREGLGS